MRRASERGRQGVALILFLTIAAAATVAAVLWYFRQQSQQVESSIEEQLRAIADTKSQQIANWRIERLGDGRVMQSPPVMELARRILSSRTSGTAGAELGGFLSSFVSAFQYASACLADVDGRVYLSVDAHDEDVNRFLPLARVATAAGMPVLSNLSIDRVSNKPIMSLTVPVDKAGALILDIDPSRFLYPYLDEKPTNSKSIESTLARRDGPDYAVLLNRTSDGSFIRRSITDVGLPDESRLSAGWPVRTLDFRSVPVIGVVRRIAESPWYLTVKIDQAEVDAAVGRLRLEAAAVIALIVILNLAAAAFIWRSRQFRILQDRQAWYQTVADETPAYLWMSSAAGQLSFVNEPFAAYLGADQSSFATGWRKFVHPEDALRVETHLAKCIEERSEYLDEYRLRRSDGDFRWVFASGRPMHGDNGEYSGHSGSILDITDRKLAEKEVRSLSGRLVRAAEAERARLARELHDDTSQQIAALSIATGNLKRKIPPELNELRAQGEKLQERLIRLSDSIRHISHELHPALEHSDLRSALRNYASEVAQITGLIVDTSFRGDLDGCPPETCLAFYRIAQEALHNVVKHAGAKRVVLTLTRDAENLKLTIADDGVGIAPEKERGAGGLGIASMTERARLVNATIDIARQVNGGTVVTVQAALPVAA